MSIKIGKQAIGTYVKTGRTTERKVLDYLPANSLRGQRRNWDTWFSRPVDYPTYIIDYPNEYKRVRAAKYVQYAKAMESS